MDTVLAPGASSLPQETLETLAALAAQPQVPCAVVHHFAPGLYVRETHLPAGSIIIGQKHRYRRLTMVLRGRATLYRAGHGTEIVAPALFVADAGHAVLVIHEDTVWTNTIATHETDVERISALILDPPPVLPAVPGAAPVGEAPLGSLDPCLAGPLRAWPYGSYKIYTTTTPRMGLFASAAFEAGEVICQAWSPAGVTPGGKWIRHSNTPNAVARVTDDETLVWVACQAIAVGPLGAPTEITVDYSTLTERA